jgi:DNA-directed RNA polymerase subunit RPC12/RpoP
MASCIRYVCQSCEKTIDAWDEGNPYYITPKGKKRYAYHPEPDREKCTGNDSPHLCLACCKEFNVDSQLPIDQCPKCKSNEISIIYGLEGRRCPYCKDGLFQRDPEYFCIS